MVPEGDDRRRTNLRLWSQFQTQLGAYRCSLGRHHERLSPSITPPSALLRPQRCGRSLPVRPMIELVPRRSLPGLYCPGPGRLRPEAIASRSHRPSVPHSRLSVAAAPTTPALCQPGPGRCVPAPTPGTRSGAGSSIRRPYGIPAPNALLPPDYPLSGTATAAPGGLLP